MVTGTGTGKGLARGSRIAACLSAVAAVLVAAPPASAVPAGLFDLIVIDSPPQLDTSGLRVTLDVSETDDLVIFTIRNLSSTPGAVTSVAFEDRLRRLFEGTRIELVFRGEGVSFDLNPAEEIGIQLGKAGWAGEFFSVGALLDDEAGAAVGGLDAPDEALTILVHKSRREEIGALLAALVDVGSRVAVQVDNVNDTGMSVRMVTGLQESLGAAMSSAGGGTASSVGAPAYSRAFSGSIRGSSSGGGFVADGQPDPRDAGDDPLDDETPDDQTPDGDGDDSDTPDGPDTPTGPDGPGSPDPIPSPTAVLSGGVLIALLGLRRRRR